LGVITFGNQFETLVEFLLVEKNPAGVLQV